MDNKKIYIISYWFHDYEKLYESYIKTYNIIKSFGEYRHPLEETWLVYTDKKPKEMLDEMHKAKIKMSDMIFVINPGGYIGESTRSEIEWARELNKKIKYLEP
jgi:hypothetical protein